MEAVIFGVVRLFLGIGMAIFYIALYPEVKNMWERRHEDPAQGVFAAWFMSMMMVGIGVYGMLFI